MSDSFFRDLELRAPDVNLELGGGTRIQQTADIMRRLETLFEQDRPDVLVVVGDVTSTVASALAAVNLGIPIAHVEAGLRSFDMSMPEEVNRIITDRISDFLFTTEPSGVNNLIAEGIPREKVFFVGNVMIDTLLRFRGKAEARPVLRDLGLTSRDYAVVTLHRPANVDDPERLRELIGLLHEVRRTLPVVFPVHPRTRTRIEQAGISTGDLQITAPLGYLDFLCLTSQARVVLTDSGGIQEETTILGVPCLTMRENTERPVTITDGSNRLVGLDSANILEAFREVLDGRWNPAGKIPDLWDGSAGRRIADVLDQRFQTAGHA